MGRAVTKNAQGELEVTESFSFSGSNPTLDSVKLIAVDGEEATVENPDWLGFTFSASGSDIDVILQLDASGLSTYTTYTFNIEVSDDAGNTKSRRVDVGIGSLATDFRFENIMGQEDKGRSRSGNRIENGGTARVIAYTPMPATLDIEYVGNPSNVDDPTFTLSRESVTSNARFHEFFFPVNPDSVYAFELTARADYDQSVPEITSNTFYFETGDQISSFDNNQKSTVSVSVFSSPLSVTFNPSVGQSLLDASFDKQTPDGTGSEVASSVTVDSYPAPSKTISLSVGNGGASLSSTLNP